MPSLQIFSFNSSTIKTIPFITLPYSLNSGDTIVEIDFRNTHFMIAGSKKIKINNMNCYFNKIENNDLIKTNDECIIFNEETINTPNSFFLGNFIYKDINSLLFTLPVKTSEQYFVEIKNTLTSSLDKKKIFINCNLVSYMDSSALSAMLDLIDITISKRHKLHFYSPNSKFKSYLQLAKIQKKVPIMEAKIPQIEQFIHQGRVTANYCIANEFQKHNISSNIINYIGRLTSVCNILLNDNQISRIHSAIIIINNIPYLLDCGSANQTYINNKKIKHFSLYQLKVDDTIIFGNSSNYTLKEYT